VSAPPTIQDQAFVVRLEAFSGPLDLLLHLIREQEIDIYDIPIAEIADQFLAVVNDLELNEAADYLEMAAYLVRIKVQMLLPRPFDAEEWEDPRAELVRRLLEYEQVREVAGWLAGQAGRQADRFPRGWLPEPPESPPPPITCSVAERVEAVEGILDAMPQPVLHRVVPRPLDVEGATARITALLEQRQEFDLRELIGEHPTVAGVLSVFIALLELARLGKLLLAQRELFGTLAIRRAETDAAA
jgi:segregation and condensation protein A